MRVGAINNQKMEMYKSIHQYGTTTITTTKITATETKTNEKGQQTSAKKIRFHLM